MKASPVTGSGGGAFVRFAGAFETSFKHEIVPFALLSLGPINCLSNTTSGN